MWGFGRITADCVGGTDVGVKVGETAGVAEGVKVTVFVGIGVEVSG
jgi:hypothetical protein